MPSINLSINLIISLQRCYSTQIVKSSSVIKLPVYVKKYVDSAERKELERRLDVNRRIIYRGNTKFPVIASTSKEKNHYLGQLYNEKYQLPLISKYWFKAKSSGQKFKIVPWDSNPSLPSKEKSDYVPNRFEQFNLDGNILNFLKENGYENTTPLQNLSIPGILTNRHVLCAAETGCGKTLGYLIPIFNQIMNFKSENKMLPSTPLALIVTPGRELAEQIAQVAYNLGNSCNISVKCLISNGTKHEHLKPHARENVDVLVATIGTLRRMHWKGIFKLGNLKHIVLDEADTLLDDSFFDDVITFLKFMTIQCEASLSAGIPGGAQLIIVSSTYPQNFKEVLPDDVTEQDVVRIKSPYLHRIQPHVLQKFWRVSNDSRAGELLDLVKSDFQKKVPVLVFCNKSETCDWMSYLLKSYGVPNERFHAGIDANERSSIFNAFQSGEVNVLCCTDLASRGLDTQMVRHVINFDFPNNVSDYILRAGRVGRVGTNHGYVTNLIVTVPGIHAVQEIEMAVRQSKQIANVDANIKQKINKLFLFNY